MKKTTKIGKRIAACLMAMLLCISGVSLDAFTIEAATIEHSGTDGGLSWSIDSNGHLLVEGSGNCKGSSPAWSSHTALIKTATVSVTDCTNLNYWFSGCTNLISIDLSELDTSNVTTMNGMFINCSQLADIDVSNFNTSKVTDMAQLFFQCSKLTQLDLSRLDTSKVTKTFAMFYGCSSLTSLDLSKWDMSNVTSASNMFYGCTKLLSIKAPLNVTCNINFPDLGSGAWQDEKNNIYSVLPLNLSESIEVYYNDNIIKILYSGTDGGLTWTIDGNGHLSVAGSGNYTGSEPGWYSYRTKILSAKVEVSNATSLSKYFYRCTNITTIDLTNTNTASVTNMSNMFSGCSALTDLDLSDFDTTNVTDMSNMLYGCSGLTDLDLSSFNTSNVANMSYMFSECRGLTNLDLSSFNTSNVANMSYMFSGCSGLTDLDLSGFNTSNVTNMSNMFHGCSGFIFLDLSEMDTSNVTDMSGMFRGCSKLTNIDLSGFDTSSVINMSGLFEECYQLTEVNLSSFDTSKVENMGAMFFCCQELTELDLSNFDTSHVTDISMMFMNCSKITKINLSSFNTTKMTQMISVFEYCNQLKELDLSSFDMSNVTVQYNMFNCCAGLTKLKAPMNVNIDISLPTNAAGDWETSAGEIYTCLPKNTNSSITLYCGGVVHEQVAGYTISLKGDIAVNFHMQLSDEVINDNTAYMKFTFADGEVAKVSVSDAEYDGEYYIFTCHVQAPEMNDELTAQLITSVTDTTEKYTYSVKEYADYILEHTNEKEEYAKAAPMVKAMLNYGGYSQKQFNHNADTLANEGLYTTETDPVLKETVTISDEYSLPTPSENIGLQYYGSSILLNSETTIRHYFTITSNEDIATIRERYTFELTDGIDLIPTMYKGMLCVDIRDINAAELDDIFTITVTNTESVETISLSYSVFSYAKYVLEYSLARENLLNVIKAMYFYNVAANSYFG